MAVRVWIMLVGVLAWTGAAGAQATIAPGDDVAAAINALRPGDELILSGGEYTLDGRLGVDIAGTESAPILIRAADGERPHLHRPQGGPLARMPRLPQGGTTTRPTRRRSTTGGLDQLEARNQAAQTLT